MPPEFEHIMARHEGMCAMTDADSRVVALNGVTYKAPNVHVAFVGLS